MSILHVPHYAHNTSLGSIPVILGNVIRAVTAALFTVKPVAKASASKAAAPARRDLEALFSLAGSYESVSPDLAAELRYLGRR